MTFRDIPRKHKVRIRIYDAQDQLQAEGLDFIDVIRSRKIRMATLKDQKVTGSEVMELDFNNLPRDYQVSVALFSDKDEWLGEAKMGMDFIEARREYYDQCGIEFNLTQVWNGYFSNLDKREQARLTDGGNSETESEV